MAEYQRHLDEYKSEYFLTYNTFLSEKEWGNERLAEQYLKKYWLNKDEYERIWIKIQNKIFDANFQHLPQELFLPKFELIPNIGGVLFSKEGFEALKLCFAKTGESYFFVIQNSFGQNDFPIFRMKYPTNISWNELIGGNYISTVLFETFHNDYFVFGDSELWGKYSANDEELPVDIYGVKESLISTFLDNFKNVRVINPNTVLPDPNFPNLEVHCSTLPEVKDSLPDSYKNQYIIH